MVNIFIGILIWQAIITIILALGKERKAAKVGCAVRYILISCEITIINFCKKG